MSLFRYNPEIHDHPEFQRSRHGCDPNQPRVPAGHSDGGQWTREGRTDAPPNWLAVLVSDRVADAGNGGPDTRAEATPTQLALLRDSGETAPAFRDLFNQATQSLPEPAKNELVIVVNNNGGLGLGSHAGMFIGDVLFDPGGDYANRRGRSNPDYIASLNDYVAFQLEDGGDVRVYRYSLTAEQIKTIQQRADNTPGSAPFCAADVQSSIAGVGPFKNMQPTWFTTPAALANRLKAVPGSFCIRPDGKRC